MNAFAKSDSCNASIKLLGDYWTLRIIDSLEDGELRFCELQRHVDNLNPVTLTTRLKKLEEANLINRHEATENKTAVSYTLTDNGKAAIPVLRAIDAFSHQLSLAD